MLDATSPLGVATHAHNSDQPRAPKTIDTYAEALRADGLIDLVAGGTKSVEAACTCLMRTHRTFGRAQVSRN